MMISSSAFPRMQRAVASLALLLVVAPLPMQAASSVTIQMGPVQIAPQKTTTKTADVAMTRGDFLRTAMQQLRYNLIHDSKIRPFARIPESLVPYVQTANALGALKVFGKDLNASRPITRSEAIQILVGLEASGVTAKNPLPPFADVKATTDEGKAIAIAIERGWVTADSMSVFGAKRVLKTSEAQKILSAVLTSEGKGGQTIVVPIINTRPGETSQPLPKQAIEQTVWDLVNSDFLYKDRIDAEKAGNASIQGLLKDLKDPYTVYFPPVQAQNYQSELDGEITGIGASVEMHENMLIIISPLPGSPAEKAGLRPRDIILSVDGTDLAGMDLDTAVSKVRGLKGSIAKLKINRDGNTMEFSVVRDTIKNLEIQTSWQGTVAVVRILQFGSTTAHDIRQTFTDLMKQHPTGIVLDLRNNPGGLLSAAEQVMSVFDPKGTVYMQTKTKASTVNELTEEEQIVPSTMKIVVLVTKGSASASEIVAGALQDSGHATILGEVTYGKGVMQQIYTFSDGSTLKMTIAEWLTPKGRTINGIGVKPDVALASTDSARDEQLLRALDLLR